MENRRTYIIPLIVVGGIGGYLLYRSLTKPKVVQPLPSKEEEGVIVQPVPPPSPVQLPPAGKLEPVVHKVMYSLNKGQQWSEVTGPNVTLPLFQSPDYEALIKVVIRNQGNLAGDIKGQLFVNNHSRYQKCGFSIYGHRVCWDLPTETVSDWGTPEEAKISPNGIAELNFKITLSVSSTYTEKIFGGTSAEAFLYLYANDGTGWKTVIEKQQLFTMSEPATRFSRITSARFWAS